LQVQAQEQERAQLAAVDQKPHRSTQLRSSVGAQPSSAAPIDQKPHRSTQITLFCRSAAVLGRPHRSEAPIHQHNYALLSERGRPRPPPSIRTPIH
jgi:hypothetical protein